MELATYHIGTSIAIGLVVIVSILAILALIGSGPWGREK